MDKNTIIGLLLMMAVIFGFTWLTSPSEAERAEQQRIQDSIAAVSQEQTQRPQTAAVDTLTAEDVNQLKSTLMKMAADSTQKAVIDRGGVKLSLQGDKLVGTVTVGDSTINFDELLKATAANPKLHNDAVKAVR